MIYYYPIKSSEWKAGHKEQTETAKKVLLAALRREYGLESLPRIMVDRMGKPYFPDRGDIFFNYSHCRGGILCGIGSFPIGVDIETLRNFRQSTVERICHQNEKELLIGRTEDHEILTKFWVAKEAYLKYTGSGIRVDLRLLDMSGILRGDMQNPDGSCMQLWEYENVYLCACTEKEYILQLKKIRI